MTSMMTPATGLATPTQASGSLAGASNHANPLDAMTATGGAPLSVAEAALDAAILTACDRIAPAWPLDRAIAVNPCWGFIDKPFPEVAASLAAFSGATMLMPRSWYRDQYRAGRFTDADLEAVLKRAQDTRPLTQLLAALARDPQEPTPWGFMTEAVDAGRDLTHHWSWRAFVLRDISQACAACFDEGQARWSPDRSTGLYGVWRTLARHDLAPRLLMGASHHQADMDALPDDPRTLIVEAVAALGVAPEHWADYFTALLLSVNGWASAMAFRRWEARLLGGDDEQIVHLLAARLAWELLLARQYTTPHTMLVWRAIQQGWQTAASEAAELRRDDWHFQRALELAYQRTLTRRLQPAPAGDSHTTTASATVPRRSTAQVVFCIDVRSEVMRRAVERATPDIETLGFAGFFGVPAAYQTPEGALRPQLPGLLAPSVVIADEPADSEEPTDRVMARMKARAAAGVSWKQLSSTPSSMFTFVESAGLAWAAALLRDGLKRLAPTRDPLRADDMTPSAPQLTRSTDGTVMSDAQRVALAAGILRTMSLTQDFAPLLVLLGHGASTSNNPQAAALQCGACGGQTGELNARAAAALLNDATVRMGLAQQGIDLGTTFVLAGLHDTTTDDVTLYDVERVPAEHAAALDMLRDTLRHAADLARAERAPGLGIAATTAEERASRIRARARDWAELRPEWGLAGNAAFVIAPRARTRGLDLGGRVFLHDYRWTQDNEFRVLDLLMSAPMVVAHWINLQYYASTVDPLRYGSGNKVLHNVVGGRLGVLEGGQGDLRIGLARQSVHDGSAWRHEPLRLSVFVEAPTDAIDAVLARHRSVDDLVRNEWLHLHCLDPISGMVTQRRADGWHEVESWDVHIGALHAS